VVSWTCWRVSWPYWVITGRAFAYTYRKEVLESWTEQHETGQNDCIERVGLIYTRRRGKHRESDCVSWLVCWDSNSNKCIEAHVFEIRHRWMSLLHHRSWRNTITSGRIRPFISAVIMALVMVQETYTNQPLQLPNRCQLVGILYLHHQVIHIHVVQKGMSLFRGRSTITNWEVQNPTKHFCSATTVQRRLKKFQQ